MASGHDTSQNIRTTVLVADNKSQFSVDIICVSMIVDIWLCLSHRRGASSSLDINVENSRHGAAAVILTESWGAICPRLL